MKYIEDFVALFAYSQVRVSDYDKKIADSLGWQCVDNKAFTQKQSEIAIRLLKKYKKQFLALGKTEIEGILETPVFRNSIRVIDLSTSVIFDKKELKFKIKFPFNQELVTKLRQFGSKSHLAKPYWDADNKSWNLDSNEISLDFIASELVPLKFEISEEIVKFLEESQKIKENFEDYMPMLVKGHDSYYFKNVKTNFSSQNLLDALTESVQLGVPVYDDQISEEIDIICDKNPMYKVFKNQEKQNFVLDKKSVSRTQVLSFMKEMKTVNAIFLDENVRAETLKSWIFDLISCGVELDEVGVYFRQRNENNGVEFNTVVKDCKLNKTADDNVKWMFLTTKYPKSLVKNGKIAEICLFDNHYVFTHHTVQSIIKNSIFNFAHNEHTRQGDNFVVL